MRKNIPNGRPLVEVFTESPRVKVTDFQVVSFHDEWAKRPDGMTGTEIVLIYALGEDGVIREFSGGKWTSFPIT